ncbi:MAG: transglutaminase family protein [Pseudomonadota bacterium]
MDIYLKSTRLLDFESPVLRNLVQAQAWMQLPERQRIGVVYEFVRDRIAFGYNESDDLPASRVLSDGYGQCNTKTTLLMALLRGCKIPCRFHGATIHKRLQKGVVSGLFYYLAPADIIHSWTEVFYEGRWIALEGVILDLAYLSGLRAALPPDTREFVGFGVGIDDLGNPPVAWNGSDTFIQIKGVNNDFGVYDDPDSFYAAQGSNFRGVRRLLFKYVVRHVMNAKVRSIRTSRGLCIAAASTNDMATRSR